MLECKFCKNQFISKYVLKSHQKTAKYCLTYQRKEPEINHICDGCDKKFTVSGDLSRHQKKCNMGIKLSNSLIQINELKEYKEKYYTLSDTTQSLKIEHQKEIQILQDNHKKEIRILQDKLENIAIQAVKRPSQTTTYNNRTQINNIIEKMDIVTDNHLKDQTPNLTIEHIKQGVKGYVEYAMKYPLKNRILCVDYARRKIKYRDENGETSTDPEMTKLSQKFFESIADKNKALAMEVVSQLPEDLDPENKMKIVCDMAELMSSVNQSAVGNKTDFTHDFVRGVCSKTVC